MQNKLGGSVIDTVVPLLLRDLQSGDQTKADLSMQGLRQLLALRGRDVMSVLVPKLLKTKGSSAAAAEEEEKDGIAGEISSGKRLSLFQATTLAEISETTGDIMHHYVSEVMTCLLSTLQAMTEDGYDEELSTAVRNAMRSVLVHCSDEEGLQWTMLEYINVAVASKSPTLRAAALWCMGEFSESSKIDFEDHVTSIAVTLMDRFFDHDENVLEAAHKSLTQLNKRIPAETLAQDMKALRLALTTAISREKYKKNVQIHEKMGCYVVREMMFYFPLFSIDY